MYIKELLYLQLPTLEEKNRKKMFSCISALPIFVCIHDRHIVSTLVLQSMQLSALVFQHATYLSMKAIYS